MVKGLSRFLAVAFFCLSLPVVAAEDVKLRSGLHPDYARIVIDWPRYQQTTASLSNNRLVVLVPAGNSFDLSALQQGIRGYTGPVRLLADAQTLEFPLLGDFELSQQRIANKAVIDLRFPSREAQKAKKIKDNTTAEPLQSSRSVPTAEATAAALTAADSAAPVTAQEQSSNGQEAGQDPASDKLPEVGFRFARHDGYDRLVFDWTEPVKASLGPSSASGLRVSFNKPARIRLSSLRQRPMTFVKAGSQHTERPAIVDFDLAGDYQTKLFKVGQKVVIDVSHRASAPPVEAASKAESVPGQPTASSPGHDPGERAEISTVPLAPTPAEVSPKTALKRAEPTSLLPQGNQEQEASSEKSPEFPLPLEPSEAPLDQTASPSDENNGNLLDDRKAFDSKSLSREGQSPDNVAVAQGRGTDGSLAASAAPISLRDFGRQRLEEEAARAKQAQEEAQRGALAAISPAEQDFVERVKPASDSDLIAVPGRSPRLLPPLILNFNWKDDVHAAAYQRGGSLWLVFDREGPAYLERALRQLLPEVEALECVPVSGATVIRMDLPATHIPRLNQPQAEEGDATAGEGQAAKTDSQGKKKEQRTPEQAPKDTRQEPQAIYPNRWVLDIRRRTPLPQEAVLSKVVEEDGEKQVKFMAPSARRLFSIPDDRLGDRVVVAPLGQPNLGIVRHDRYSQFEALPSYQGVVLYPRSERLVVATNDEGVIVRSKDELLLSSPSERKKPGRDFPDPLPRNPLIDFEVARKGPLEHYETHQRMLWKKLSGLAGKNQDLARFELAQFYFAHGHMNEALGMLNLIESKNPRLVQDPLAQLIRGAAHFGNKQYDEAYRILSTPFMVGEKETVLWHAALAAAAHDWKPAAAGFKQSQDMIASLPGSLRNQFYFMAIESYLNSGDDLRLGKTFRQLEKAMKTMTPYEIDQYNYLLASRQLVKGDEEAAIEALKTLRHSRHRPTSARARYKLLQLVLDKGEISPKEAIDQVEQLRFAWRGDSFEFILLNKLAELYAQEGDYRRSLESLRQAAAHFAFSERADHSVGRMAEIFESMYFEDGGRRIPPLTAIALYEEFKELTPAGAKGDVMIAKLADRLVDVDLLEQASGLLDYQVNNRLVGTERRRVASRLALLGLLDDRPQDALDVLDRTAADPETQTLPESLLLQRRHLRAQALADLGRSDDALELLSGDNSLDGLRLTVDILWKERRWPEVTQQLGFLVPSTPPEGRAMKESEAQTVLNLALAQALSGDQEGLALLTTTYQDAMKETPQGTVFSLLSRNSGSDADFSIARQLAEVAEFEAFMDQFSKQIDQDGLSAVGQ